jgi:aminomethyltransferase
MVDFHGWEMPLDYGSILEEHRAVRTAAGLFDVSHLGEVAVEGPGAQALLDRLLTQRMDLEPGRARYALMLDPQGGVVDDLVAYRLGAEAYLLVVNASRREADLAWMGQVAAGTPGVRVEDRSDGLALLALQGPRAEAILDPLCEGSARPLRRFRFREAQVAGVACRISRTGYTGEDGFELGCAAGDAPALWAALLEAGAPEGLRPAGLGARDLLRLEAALPLYGQELGPDLSPLTAGLERFVDLTKPEFIGRSALLAERAAGVPRRLVGLVLEERRGVPRPGHPVRTPEGAPAGRVTSGGISPSLGGTPIALAVVDRALAEPDTPLTVEIRGRNAAARVVRLPFYTKRKGA